MKKIVVATDFSTRSDRAVRRAILLAKTHGAALTIVHVVDDDQPKRMVEAERQTAAEVLSQQTRSVHEIDGLSCQSKIVLGDPFEGITEAARDLDADLLVIGPHRRQILKDVFVGTTAERTIRSTSRPVLMANGVPAGPYRHVLVAVDLSACSAAALRTVQALRLDAGNAVSVVHVFDAPAASLMTRATSGKAQIDAYLADEEERAAHRLAAFLRDVGLEPVQRILKAPGGSTASRIRGVAQEIGADLIVVGTRGRTGIAKALLGSVAEEVLRVADRDVMAVPPQRGE